MEEVRQSASLERRHEGSPARALAEQREQIKRYLAELAESADTAEREIAESVRQLLVDVTADRDGAQHKRDVQAARNAERTKQLDVREQELETLRADVERREAAAVEATRQKSRYDERLRRLDEREEELETERQRTKVQRRRIAGELKDEREAGRREALRHAEELEASREELRRRTDDLQRRTADLDRREVELATTAAATAGAGDAQLRGRLQSLEASLEERNAALAEVAGELDDLRRRLADYKAKLIETEARLTEAAANRGDGAETTDLRRRYEEAVENVHDLKLRCTMLEKARASGAAPAASGEVAMDWESQKKRFLAALDATDPRDVDAQADRLTIEGTIRITDNVVAEKDREIEELQRRLAERPGGNHGAEAVEAIVAQDEIIARHRADAERLRSEWNDMLRSAEIEISMERAKLARERTALDERRAEFDAQQARLAKDVFSAPTSGQEPRKSGGGRWLARLGLRDDDQA